ncbi:MAG: bifunctional lysylphosphatidylglycerol flippase/synthetase MprF [bacterium]|nr:bifunctional lysylphosphatidylglycerol flippase/synthetase MprF [bacterium]
MKRFGKILGSILGIGLFSLALWVLHRELRAYNYHQVVGQLGAINGWRVALGVALTGLSYFILTGYDTLAFRYIGHPLEYRKVATASFIGYAFAYNIGLSNLAGGSIRYRLYSAWGLSAVEIAQVIVFCGLSLWLGFCLVGGLIFLGTPLTLPSQLPLPFADTRPFGAILLALVAAGLALTLLRPRPIRVRDWVFTLPSPRLYLAELAISSIDWLVAGTVFFALLPASAQIHFTWFMGIFMLAHLVGAASNIPAGLGVFEMVIIPALSSYVPGAQVVGVVVVYRIIYYILPLITAAGLLGIHEVSQRREGVRKIARFFGQWVPEIVPQVMAFTTFVGGAMLLFSGATPTVPVRLEWLKDFLPLPVIEISHFLGSLAGMGLLILARGLQRRLDAAWHLTVALLTTGIVVSLLKGLDYEEALALSVMLAALFPSRGAFYRKAAFFSQRFTPGWITAIAVVVGASLWIGFFSYKHLEYSSELWWRFSFSPHSDASRFLRASVGVGILALAIAAYRLIQPAQPEPHPPTAAELDLAGNIVDRFSKTYAKIALLGDKDFMFNDDRSAFLMYGIEGRSWVALGDPVGPREARDELVWQFRELCDRHGGWSVFYHVQVENLHLYLDLGLTMLKLGEEALVPLGAFTMTGGSRKSFRHAVRRMEEAGCRFEWVPREEVPALLPRLRVISDAWLAGKNAREKGFSLGYFDEAYLKRNPIALIHQGDRLLAFANIWAGAGKEELSIDMMRYLPDAPPGVMDYLFIQLMLEGQRQGYGRFNLGMAPLSGLENRALAPFWMRVGSFIFKHGEHFYNFQGLRQYKEKFDPIWEPKYLASPGTIILPRILTNIAALISRGIGGILTK